MFDFFNNTAFLYYITKQYGFKHNTIYLACSFIIKVCNYQSIKLPVTVKQHILIKTKEKKIGFAIT